MQLRVQKRWWPLFRAGTGSGYASGPLPEPLTGEDCRHPSAPASGHRQPASAPARKAPKTSAPRGYAAVSSPVQPLPDSDDPGFLLPDGVEGGERLPYPEAASTFLAWLQGRGDTGEMSHARLVRLYGQQCEDLGLAWLPLNNFFSAFATLIGRHRRFTRRVRERGRDRRVATYDVPRASSAARRVAAA